LAGVWVLLGRFWQHSVSPWPEKTVSPAAQNILHFFRESLTLGA
jgi:hypothetical protein